MNITSAIQQIIRNKCLPPYPPEKILIRRRIIHRLRGGIDQKLILMIAPSGYSKSTSLNQWFQDAQLPSSWFSLDKYDNDPAFFLKGLVTSLQFLNEEIGKDIFQKLQSSQKPAIEELLRGLVNEIREKLDESFLVLENFHHLQLKPVLNMVTFFIENLPENLHLVITSHREVPLNLASLRTHDQILELRAPYLAFTTEELEEYLNKQLNLQIPYGDLSAILQYCQSIPELIRYAALCLQRAPDIGAIIRAMEYDTSGKGHLLFEFLFSKLDKEIQMYLIETSILSSFNLELAAYLTGRSIDEEIVTALARENIFLLPLSPDSDWFVFNVKAQEYLWNHLHQWDRQQLDGLHQRASEWLGSQGEILKAIEHAIAATEWELAARWVELAAQEFLQQGHLVTVISWLGKLPTDLFIRKPMLSIIKAWGLIISQQYDVVEEVLQQALKAADNDSNPQKIIDHVQAIREFLSFRSKES